jgi:predicted nucleotidyltransferase
MLDLAAVDPTLLHLVDGVVTGLLAESTLLGSGEVMLVGAHCRDILQSAFGHDFPLRATSDIDLGLAMANWAAYAELTERLTAVGSTGVRFWIARTAADLMPFGPVEDPPGTVTPSTRREPISVWGFAEVFAAALRLELPTAGAIRIPTAAGYAALKLAAWLDRSAYGEYKDAADIATVIYWYSKSSAVENYLYQTEHGQDLLVQEELDDAAASGRVLGEHIAEIIGPERVTDLAGRLSGPSTSLLGHYMTVTNAPGWASSPSRRQRLFEAVERGIGRR